MSYFIQHGQDLFILFAFPLLGLGLDSAFDRKKIRYILICSLILMAPIVTGYAYIVSNTYQVLGLVSLACFYAFFSAQIEKNLSKVILAIILSGILLLILGYASFIAGMAGLPSTEAKWKIGRYKIEYIKNKGFSGGALMQYQLSKYSLVPIFIKQIETVSVNDTSTDCNIRFDESKVLFNKCNGTIVQDTR